MKNAKTMNTEEANFFLIPLIYKQSVDYLSSGAGL